MVKIIIDGKTYEVDEGITVIQACEEAGIEILGSVITKSSPLLVIVECVLLKWKILINL